MGILGRFGGPLPSGLSGKVGAWVCLGSMGSMGVWNYGINIMALISWHYYLDYYFFEVAAGIPSAKGKGLQ